MTQPIFTAKQSTCVLQELRIEAIHYRSYLSNLSPNNIDNYLQLKQLPLKK